MDAKITKNRVGHLLSYDWIKILAICAAVVVVWVILFTTIAPRATDGQKFEVYVYTRVSYYTDRFGKLDSLHEKDALSYDVLDYSVNTLLEDSASTVLAAHFGAGQGDVMFISGYEYEETDSDGNKTTTSDLKNFLYSYGGNCVWLGDSADYPLGESTNPNAQSYLGNCRAYLEKYYPDGLGGEMDKSAVESDFRARAKGDNRYKRESQIKAGLEKEYVRIERLLEGYNNVMGYLEDGTVSITSVEAQVQSNKDENGDGRVDENDVIDATLQYSFDLSNVTGLDKLLTSTRSADGTSTREGVNMIVLNTRLQEEALRYEQITFLDFIVRESARLQTQETA